MKFILKWILRIFLLAVIVAAVAGYVARESLLEKAGHFLAPQGDYTADAVILEGADYIRTGFVEEGLDLLKAGKVRRVIVVIHRIAPAHRPFGINGDYPDIVREKLKAKGLKDSDFQVIVAPIRSPVTLKEAQFVLQELAGGDDKIQTAILVAPGFHTRRSYLAYAHLGGPLSIRIFPSASFTNYTLDQWWTDKAAVREFCAESFKLFYYLAFGHIPFKFSYSGTEKEAL